MKIRTLVLFLSPFLSFGQIVDTVDFKNLQYKDNSLIYKRSSTTPFTGVSVGYWDNGQKSLQGTYKDGEKDGLWMGWYENGQISSKQNYKSENGVGRYEEGPVESWYKNGQKSLEGSYKNGRQEGVWFFWYENGRKKEKMTHGGLDGMLEGPFIKWYENGKKKSEGNYNKGGEVESFRLWDESGHLTHELKKDELPAKKGNEDLPKKYQDVDTVEFNGIEFIYNLAFKIGTTSPFTGVRIEYYDNAQKKSLTNYKGGVQEGIWSEWDEDGRLLSKGTWIDGKNFSSSFEYFQGGFIWEYKFVSAVGSRTDMNALIASIGWYKNGQKSFDRYHSNGDSTGTWTSWYEDGQIESITTYVNGKRATYQYFTSESKEQESKREKSKETFNKIESAFWIIFTVICFGLPILLLRWLLLRKNKSFFTYLFIVIVKIFLLIELFVFFIGYILTGWRPNG